MKYVLLSLALAVSGAAPIAAEEPYRAHGSGPSWSLTIADGWMTYEAPDQASLSVASSRADSGDGFRTYRTRRLTVEIMAQACSDGTSDRRYAESVSVTVGRRQRHGCGGPVLAPDDLTDTSWHFAEIGGETVPLTGDILADDSYAIDFSASGFVGYGGCNRFSAAYSRSGETLTARAPWGSTTGICAEPVMGRERRLLQILSQPVRVSLPDFGTLLLIGESGTIRLIRTRSED